jgi:hypothetical protein
MSWSTTERLRELARLSAAMDVCEPSRLAIVASDLVTFGIARIYEVFRKLDTRSTKKVAVFRTVEEAIVWLKTPQVERPRRQRRTGRSRAPQPPE